MPTGHLGETTTDPKGNTVTKVYDRNGRPYQVKSGADTTTYAYFANGNRQSMTYPNGVVAQYTYYADNRLHTLANKHGNTYLSTFNYAYDGNGNMLAKLELKGTTSYVYDVVNRLKKVTEPDGRVTQYTFDAAGNRLTETVTVNNSDTITEYDYNNQCRLISTVETSDDAEKTTGFEYDNNGSQISRLVSTISDASGDAGLSLVQPGTGTEDGVTFEVSAYDPFGRLVSVQNDNYVASYRYNAEGLRIAKDVTSGGVTTSMRFLYEGGYVTLELDGAGADSLYKS
jgi:YD repeat-containing protein